MPAVPRTPRGAVHMLVWWKLHSGGQGRVPGLWFECCGAAAMARPGGSGCCGSWGGSSRGCPLRGCCSHSLAEQLTATCTAGLGPGLQGSQLDSQMALEGLQHCTQLQVGGAMGVVTLLTCTRLWVSCCKPGRWQCSCTGAGRHATAPLHAPVGDARAPSLTALLCSSSLHGPHPAPPLPCTRITPQPPPVPTPNPIHTPPSPPAVQPFQPLPPAFHPQRLNLAECCLEEVPPALSAVRGLTCLTLNSNTELGGEDNERRVAPLAALTALRVLEMRDCGLNSVPAR